MEWDHPWIAYSISSLSFSKKPFFLGWESSPPFQQVALKNILIQSGQAGPLDGALIVMQMLAEGFIAVQFIIGHRQVCIAYPDIGAFHPASTFIIAGALG